MAKFKTVMNAEKFKKAVNGLPANPPDAVDFLGFRATKEGDKDVYIGLYVGTAMAPDYNKDKGTFKSPTLFKGTIRRSPKHPNKKLVLESAGQKSVIKELGKESLKANKLKFAIVAVQVGEAEPDVSPEELAEMGLTEETTTTTTTTTTATTATATTATATTEAKPARPTVGPPTTRPTTPDNAQPTAPQQAAKKPAFQKAQPSIASTGPTAGRSRGYKELMPRVSTVMGKIKEIEEVDRQIAAPFSSGMKEVLNAMHGEGTPQQHDIVSGMLTTLEGPKLWDAHAKARVGKRRAALHQGMAGRFQIVGNNTFVAGEAARVDAKINPGNADKVFGTLIKQLTACEGNRDAKTLNRFEGLCQAYVQGAQSLPDETPQGKERLKFVKTQLTHARLAQQALKYQALGDPSTWDPTKEARAGEIQAAYFFEEGSLHAKEGEYGADALGGSGGVNGSWWIRRVDPADKDGKGSRKFIFKPADAEAEAVVGFKPGSSAPREVMAKALNDELLATAGFDVGVCPTTLAEIDSTKLPDQNGKVSSAPSRLGSMQQLAESEGAVADLLNNPDVFKTVPKDNMDQIVVFDMISGAVDRHYGNLMVGSGPNGTKQLVPIDHGLTMPGKGALYLQRRRPVQNHALLQTAVDVNNHRDQPLSPAVKEGLLKLKPDQIAAKMKLARDDMRTAHPGMADDMPDENFQVMQRNMEFLQKACAKDFSVADLVTVNSKYCVEIQEAKPNELDALVDRIAQELPAHKAGLVQLEKIFPPKPGGGLTETRCGEQLRVLGWLMDLDNYDGQVWATENAALASRIITGKIVNPALKQRIDALVQQLGGPDKVKELKIDLNGKPIKVLDRLKEAAVENGPLKDLDEPKLQTAYDNLGGDAEYQKVRAAFPIGATLAERLAKKEKVSARDRLEALRLQIRTLNDWAAFQAEGGADAFYKEVGLFDMNDASVNVPKALERLRGAKAEKNGLQAIAATTDQALVQQKVQQAQAAANVLPRPTAVQALTIRLQAVTAALNNANADPIQLLADAAKVWEDAAEAPPVYAEWEKKLAVLKQAVSLLKTKKHAKAAEMEAARDQAEEALDAGRGSDALAACQKLDQLVKDATAPKK